MGFSVPAFRELPPRRKRIEFARWLLLWPGAFLASLAVRQTVGLAVRASGLANSPQPVGFWLATAPYYVLPTFTLVVVGGWIAPRRPLVAALVLALAAGGLSLLKHVVLQSLSGNRVGTTNWMHFGLETAGLLMGAACVYRWSRANPG